MTRPGDKEEGSVRRVAIVGGGISGLATAFFLSESLDPSEAEIVLLESSSVLGGVIRSESTRNFLWEGGPDSFASQKPEALDLCRQLGLEDDLVRTPPHHRQAYVLSEQKLYPLPLNRSTFLTTPLLSWQGRLRAILEPLIGASTLEDESVSDFIVRRLGREVSEKIFEPLVVGVYGGDPHQLSIRSTLPHLYRAERSRRGLTKALLQMVEPLKPKRFGEKKESLLSLKKGMAELVQTLVERLQGRVDLRLQAPVSEVTREEGRFRVRVGGEAEDFDTVVLATPAASSAPLVSNAFPEVADLLQGVPYVSAVIVAFGYDQEVLSGRTGTGFLVPPSEAKTLSACTWVNHKFPGRCPEGYELLRCFIGGDQAGEWISSDDEEVVDRMKSELKDTLSIVREPVSRMIYRWQTALPQYRLGHHGRIERLNREVAAIPGLHLVGNFLDGVGISDCIRHARRVCGDMKETDS
ncbi:MAG: protoporphyrinogen oxidase [Acidobacteriota bacterium]